MFCTGPLLPLLCRERKKDNVMGRVPSTGGRERKSFVKEERTAYLSHRHFKYV